MSRAFMEDAASQSGDADCSLAYGLMSSFLGSLTTMIIKRRKTIKNRKISMSIFPSPDQCLSLENIYHSFLMLFCRRMSWECNYYFFKAHWHMEWTVNNEKSISKYVGKAHQEHNMDIKVVIGKDIVGFLRLIEFVLRWFRSRCWFYFIFSPYSVWIKTNRRTYDQIRYIRSRHFRMNYLFLFLLDVNDKTDSNIWIACSVTSHACRGLLAQTDGYCLHPYMIKWHKYLHEVSKFNIAFEWSALFILHFDRIVLHLK